MNEILEAIKQRRSIRKYKPDMPSDDLIDKIVEAGMYAPSGLNRQGVKLIVIKDKSTRDEFSRENARIWGKDLDPFFGAPVVIVVIAEKDWRNSVQDGSLAMGNMLLAAHSLGLGSCWINRCKEEFDSDFGKNFLRKIGIEGEWIGVGHCIIGYPDCEHPSAPKRKENRVYKIE